MKKNGRGTRLRVSTPFIKCLLMMKMTILLICAFSIQSIANDGFAQEKITLRLENTSLRKAFKVIEKQSSFRFVYNEQVLPPDRKISISVQAMPLDQVMALLLQNTMLSFKLIGADLVVIAAEPPPVAASDKETPAISVTGKIVNTENQPLANISVVEKGTTNGTVTKENGSFSLNVSDANATLTISSVGFVSQEVSLGGRTSINITLKETSSELNQVVVVGYGTSRKKDLTGSVSSIPMTNTDKTPIFGTSQLLQGMASGVQVMQTNSQPGASFTVRIRGTSSITSSSDPLYVVDGYAEADISTINPSDIASIEVLKDASATAIYGSRGANGVIMITTKKGTPGKNTIAFDMYTGVQQVGRKLKLMNAKQFATYLNQVTTYNNLYNTAQTALPYTQAQIDAMGPGTDWQDELFRTSPISNYTLGFSGGNTDTRYYLSMNYFTQQGIIINSDYKRGTIRFNLDKKISEKLKMGYNSQVSYDLQNQANINTSGGSGGGTLLDALRASPIVPVYDSTGAFTFQNGPQPYVEILGNPVAAARLNSDLLSHTRIFSNVFGEYDIIKGLKFRTSLGGQYDNSRENTFRPNTTYLGKTTNGYAQVITNNNYNWLNENYFTFDRQINPNHALNIVGGITYQEWKNASVTTTATNLSTNNLGTDNLSVGASLSATSNTIKRSLLSYIGRVNYRLLDKYLFTFTMREDGSSVFGADRKWGFFPSGAIAWRMSEEKFIQDIKDISDLKLRVSYGAAGNQAVPPYNSLAQYASNAYGLNGVRVVGFSPGNIPNPLLGWETTSTFDAGFDLGLFNNRVTLTGDYYYKKTSDLLYSVSVPSSSGFSTILENIGSLQNQGFELSLTTTNIDKKHLRWTTNFNYSQNRNKILNLGAVSYQLTGNVSSSLYPGGQNSSILQVGQSIGSFYGYVFNGIWQSQSDIIKSGTKQSVKPGDPIYKDISDDSLLTALGDKTIIGHALPKFTFGFTSNLTVGRFNLFVLIQGVYGSDILNENKIETENGATLDNKFVYVGERSWTGPGTSNLLPSVGSTLRRGLGVTSDVIEDGSYMRFKTLTLSYDLPLPKLSSVFKSASVYITGQNLITLTSYSGYDPEVNSYSNTTGNYTSLNTDYNPYPNVRTYMAGIKLGF